MVDLDIVAIAAVVRSCPLVDGLHSGREGRIVTASGAVRQVGVCVAGSCLVVGVVGRPGAGTEDIAVQVRSALSVHAAGYQVTVSMRGGDRWLPID